MSHLDGVGRGTGLKQKTARNWVIVAVVALLMVASMTDWFSKSLSFLEAVPWFVYLLFAAILFSGYQFVRLSREDYKTDQEWIEEEGNVFLRRIEQERERRAQFDTDSEDIEVVYHHENEGE